MKFVMTALLLLFCLIRLSLFSQQTPSTINGSFNAQIDSPSSHLAQSLNGISNGALQALDNRYSLLNKLVERHTEKMLKRMKKKELALQNKLQRKDSVKAASLFAGAREKYQQLLARVQSGNNVQVAGQSIGNLPSAANPLKEYIPGVDSMQTALRFLNQPGLTGLPTDQLQKIQAASLQLQQLQGSLQQANDAQNYVRAREQQLKDQLSSYGLGKELTGLNSEVYYYQARLSQYKAILNDPDERQQAILSAVRQLPLFQRFFQQNSYFSQLFPVSPYAGTPQALAGLQTRDQLQQQLQQKFGMSPLSVGDGGGGTSSYLQNQMQTARTQLNAIKDRLSQSGASGSDMTMPDFQPNNQHIKTFIKRLEYSFTIQNTAGTSLLPAISSLGLNIGYKLSDKATVGIGGSYLLGLGNGLDHIRLSNQGIGWRTYADIKAKGSIWITGGWEYNYMQQFSGLQSIRNIDAWQKSALIGLTKKYKIGKKEGNLQLLYDLLADSELPRGQPIIFRMGWGF